MEVLAVFLQMTIYLLSNIHQVRYFYFSQGMLQMLNQLRNLFSDCLEILVKRLCQKLRKLFLCLLCSLNNHILHSNAKVLFFIFVLAEKNPSQPNPSVFTILNHKLITLLRKSYALHLFHEKIYLLYRPKALHYRLLSFLQLLFARQVGLNHFRQRLSEMGEFSQKLPLILDFLFIDLCE